MERSWHSTPEAGLYWYHTSCNYHENRFSINATIQDPCFLYEQQGTSVEEIKKRSIQGFAWFQTADIAGSGTYSFLAHKSKKIFTFDFKLIKILNHGQSICFKEADIRLKTNVYNNSQVDLEQTLCPILETEFVKREFVAQ